MSNDKLTIKEFVCVSVSRATAIATVDRQRRAFTDGELSAPIIEIFSHILMWHQTRRAVKDFDMYLTVVIMEPLLGEVDNAVRGLKNSVIMAMEDKVDLLLNQMDALGQGHWLLKRAAQVTKPFAHEDFCKPSPLSPTPECKIYGRNKAEMTLGDCIAAREFQNELDDFYGRETKDKETS